MPCTTTSTKFDKCRLRGVSTTSVCEGQIGQILDQDLSQDEGYRVWNRVHVDVKGSENPAQEFDELDRLRYSGR